MPTSLVIVGLEPPDANRPFTAPWAPGTAGRVHAARQGFRDDLFDQGHCHYLYDSPTIRRRDAGQEIGRRSAQVMLAAARHQPTVFVLFGENVSRIFQRELAVPDLGDPFPCISVSDRLHLVVLPEAVGGSPSLRENAKRTLYAETSAFLLDILAEEPFHGATAGERYEAA